MIDFLKKHKGNLLLAIIIGLFLIPGIRMPIQVKLQRLFIKSPSALDADNREIVKDYNWPLKTLKLDNVNLHSSIGNVVVINFWATWCPPCVAEMPSLQALYDDYGDKVDFYFVSSEENEKLQKFIKKNDYDFPVYIQEFEAPEILETSVLPTTYILSKSGAIVMNVSGAADWDSDVVHETLENLLKE